MLLMRDLWRILTNTIAFTWSTGGFWILIAIALVAVVAAITTSVTVIGPVLLYPLI